MRRRRLAVFGQVASTGEVGVTLVSRANAPNGSAAPLAAVKALAAASARRFDLGCGILLSGLQLLVGMGCPAWMSAMTDGRAETAVRDVDGGDVQRVRARPACRAPTSAARTASTNPLCCTITAVVAREGRVMCGQRMPGRSRAAAALPDNEVIATVPNSLFNSASVFGREMRPGGSTSLLGQPVEQRTGR